MNKPSENIVENWKTALSQTKFRWFFYLAILYFSIFPWKADDFFQYIQLREGYDLNDYLLQIVPANNHSYLIFGIIYLSVIYLLLQLLKQPKLFIWFAWAFNIETTLRFICIYFIPLNPPQNLVELHDPLAEIFIYGKNLAITKDLFFSGHTATMIFVCYFLKGKAEKTIAITLTILLAYLLLIQHIHYTIDILGAVFFTLISILIARKITSF
ncbi:MAG: hypothetical protein RJA76_1201 [Bacteroidota bacterium]|jgi:hypothetical protein